jgi:hypothetical protein
MQKRTIALLVSTLLTLGLMAGPAAADPEFGPGSSGGGPNAANAKCHPPGQTVDTPGCK